MINIDSIYGKKKLLILNSDKNMIIVIQKLTIEISELAYETKCFKYWKDDKPSSQEITIAEYVNCLMITLCFCDFANIKII